MKPISTLNDIHYKPCEQARKKIRQLYNKMQKEKGRATLQMVLDQVLINTK